MSDGDLCRVNGNYMYHWSTSLGHMRCSRMQIGTQMVQTQEKIHIQIIWRNLKWVLSILPDRTYNEITLCNAIQLYATYIT